MYIYIYIYTLCRNTLEQNNDIGRGEGREVDRWLGGGGEGGGRTGGCGGGVSQGGGICRNTSLVSLNVTAKFDMGLLFGRNGHVSAFAFELLLPC